MATRSWQDRMGWGVNWQAAAPMCAWVIYLEDKLFSFVQAAPDAQSAIRAAAQVYGIIDPKEQTLLNAQPFRAALAERAAMPSLSLL